MLLTFLLAYISPIEAFTPWGKSLKLAHNHHSQNSLCSLNSPPTNKFSISNLNEDKQKQFLSIFMCSSTDTDTSDADLFLTTELSRLVEGFKLISDERTRYKNLMFLANSLSPIDDDVRIPENKVPGCLSTVHVDCDVETDENGNKVVNFYGDSDGLLTKGLLALLIRGFSGCTPDEIEAVNPRFIEVAGISQTLTPGRNNGFLNMVEVMKRKSREAVDGGSSETSTTGDEATEVKEEQSNHDNEIVTSFEERDGKPMYNLIMSTLISTLKPVQIELVDNSSQHAGHAGSKGWEESGESHFALSIVADAFEGMALVKRHQMIYLLLGSTMEKIHALQISAKTSSEV